MALKPGNEFNDHREDLLVVARSKINEALATETNHNLDISNTKLLCSIACSLLAIATVLDKIEKRGVVTWKGGGEL